LGDCWDNLRLLGQFDGLLWQFKGLLWQFGGQLAQLRDWSNPVQFEGMFRQFERLSNLGDLVGSNHSLMCLALMHNFSKYNFIEFCSYNMTQCC